LTASGFFSFFILLPLLPGTFHEPGAPLIQQ
jgi:hypothetical protein